MWVIHRYARTAPIVCQIARLLSEIGECRVMVYNRDGAWAKGIRLRDHFLSGGFLRRSWEETLAASDGFSARFYEDLFRAFFAGVSSIILQSGVRCPSTFRGRCAGGRPSATDTSGERGPAGQLHLPHRSVTATALLAAA